MPTSLPLSRRWLPQLAVVALLALLGTLPFWLTDLDLRAAAAFYHPEAEDPWWESGKPFWLFWYQIAPLLVGLVMVGGLAVLAGSAIWPRLRRLRLAAVFLIATTLVGPGLLVNGIFKDHWGRPRPHQTLALGGTQAYVPPLALNADGKGKSFPCGHSSAGFALGAFFLLWQRRRPRLAWLALIGSTALGILLGIGRMSAGDHFLSDVIWSAVIPWGVALALYYLVLRIPSREDAAAGRPPPIHRPLRYPAAAAGAYGLALALMVFGVLLATPAHETRNLTIDEAQGALRLLADQANVTLYGLGTGSPAASIRLKGRGFGLPTSRVKGALEREEGLLTYRVGHTGIFTEKDTTVVVGVDPRVWERIEVHTDSGDIRVYPMGEQRPQLVLQTGDGVVLDENGPRTASR